MENITEKIVPKYEFKNEDGAESLSPFKRTIAKTMEITETFTLFDAMTYLARAKKAKADKEAEIAGLDSMIQAYEEEIKLIEDTLNINELEKEFQDEVIRRVEEAESKRLEDEATADEKAEDAGVIEG